MAPRQAWQVAPLDRRVDAAGGADPRHIGRRRPGPGFRHREDQSEPDCEPDDGDAIDPPPFRRQGCGREFDATVVVLGIHADIVARAVVSRRTGGVSVRRDAELDDQPAFDVKVAWSGSAKAIVPSAELIASGWSESMGPTGSHQLPPRSIPLHSPQCPRVNGWAPDRAASGSSARGRCRRSPGARSRGAVGRGLDVVPAAGTPANSMVTSPSGRAASVVGQRSPRGIRTGRPAGRRCARSGSPARASPPSARPPGGNRRAQAVTGDRHAREARGIGWRGRWRRQGRPAGGGDAGPAVPSGGGDGDDAQPAVRGGTG